MTLLSPTRSNFQHAAVLPPHSSAKRFSMHIESKLQYGESRKKKTCKSSEFDFYFRLTHSRRRPIIRQPFVTPRQGCPRRQQPSPAITGGWRWKIFILLCVVARPTLFLGQERKKCACFDGRTATLRRENEFIIHCKLWRTIYHGESNLSRSFFWFGCFPRFSLPVRIELWHFFCEFKSG